MKNFIYLIIGFLSYIQTINAQGLIIENPKLANYYYKSYTIDTNFTFVNNAGQNVVWDFSHLQILDSSDLRYYTTNVDKALGSLFPKANLMLTGDNASEMAFYKIDKDYFEELGAIYLDDSITKRTSTLGSIDTLISYPLYFGKKWNYNRTLIEDNTAVNANAKHAVQNIKGTFEVDGEGVLILPNGIKYNALRVNTRLEFDGYAYDDSPQKIKFNKKTSKQRYGWVIKERPLDDVFYIQRSSSEFYNSKKVKTKSSSKYAVNALLPFANTNNPQETDIDHVNVHDDNILYTLRKAVDTKVNIINAEGKLVKQIIKSASQNTQGVNTISNAFADLASGIYIIAVHNTNGYKTTKYEKH